LPPLLTDWPTYEKALTWLEGMRALLEGAGVWTVELQAALGQLAGGVLMAAAGRVARPEAEPPAPAWSESSNGQPAPFPEAGCTVSERAAVLGYPATWPRAERIRVGHCVAEAYRQQHGQPPPMRRKGGNRAAIYTAADLPLVDGVLQAELGAPPGEEG